MKKTIFTALLCMTSLFAMADQYGHAIKICTDKLVINTDSLNMPKSTTAYELLTLLPDLVQRNTETEFLFKNYTIQVNGKTVGDARDAVLSQICIADLKCIEVSENSLSASSSYGQGGSISLELRDATKELSGTVNAVVSNEADYSGGLRLDHKKGKWTVQSIAALESYVPGNFNDIYDNVPKTNKLREFSEMASVFINFKPTKTDLLKLNVSEVYTNNRTWNNSNSTSETGARHSRTRNINMFVAFNYEHTLRSNGKLCAEINYRYIPEKYDYENNTTNETKDAYSVLKANNDYKHLPNNIYGELKLEQPLVKPTKTFSAKMELGSQYSVSFADNTSYGYRYQNNNVGIEESTATLNSLEDTYYLRPFLKIEANYNKWQFMGNMDYQHFAYKTEIKELKETNEALIHNPDLSKAHHTREDFTGQIVAMYKPNKRNVIRLRFERSIKRPDAQQMFPYAFINPDKSTATYNLGNPDLKTKKQNTLDLDYSLDLSNDAYHFEIKAGVEYLHSFDNIMSYSSSSIVTTYTNNGKTDIVMGDLGLYFRKGAFSAWFSGNIYHQQDDTPMAAVTDLHYTHYNLLLRPIINFNHGWKASLDVTYNSPITSDLYKTGKQFWGGMRIAKSWNNFNAYIYGKLNFIGNRKDEIYSGNKTTYNEINYMQSHIGAGVRYSF